MTGSLTPAEALELDQFQREIDAHLRRVSPLPMVELRALTRRNYIAFCRKWLSCFDYIEVESTKSPSKWKRPQAVVCDASGIPCRIVDKAQSQSLDHFEPFAEEATPGLIV